MAGTADVRNPDAVATLFSQAVGELGQPDIVIAGAAGNFLAPGELNMKTMHAQWLTVHKAAIDQDTAIEILRQTAPDPLRFLVYRISHGAPGTRPHLVTEQIGSYHGLGELGQQLCLRFPNAVPGRPHWRA